MLWNIQKYNFWQKQHYYVKTKFVIIVALKNYLAHLLFRQVLQHIFQNSWENV